MKHITVAGLLCATGLALPLSAVARDYPCQKQDWDYRCLTHTNQVGSVFIVNTSSKDVEFTVHEWISNCGWPGERVNEHTFTLTAGASMEASLVNDADPYKCREDFVFDCYTVGPEKNCHDLLSVVARIR